ncbi:MAG: hypothetical protein RSA84_24070 [Acinetobacter sp.]
MDTNQKANELTPQQIEAFERLAEFSKVGSLDAVDLAEAESFKELKTIEGNTALSDDEWLAWLRSLRNSVITLTAEKSGFTGNLSFQYWWGSGGGVFYCYTVQYKICGSGGNKANINWAMIGRQKAFIKSPDAMWQTCEWLSWRTGGWIASHADLSANIGATFIFDKSGGDPEAHAAAVLRY